MWWIPLLFIFSLVYIEKADLFWRNKIVTPPVFDEYGVKAQMKNSEFTIKWEEAYVGRYMEYARERPFRKTVYISKVKPRYNADILSFPISTQMETRLPDEMVLRLDETPELLEKIESFFPLEKIESFERVDGVFYERQ